MKYFLIYEYLNPYISNVGFSSDKPQATWIKHWEVFHSYELAAGWTETLKKAGFLTRNILITQEAGTIIGAKIVII